MKTRKLSLDLEALDVESFATQRADAETEKGTVHAHISQLCTRENGATCGTNNTCNFGYTCDGDYTCNFRSCDGACGTYYCSDSSPQISQMYVDTFCV